MPVQQVQSFVNEVKRVYSLEDAQDDRRAVPRMHVNMPLVVRPLDDELQPVSCQYHAVTSDLSSQGVGLITSSRVRSGYALLQFMPCHGESLRVIGRVAHCTALGHYFKVGCEFVLSWTMVE